jgi:3-deoxy-manno-octulosonate cytidylyltransferase (CMP-KDO synthetase)
MKTLVVIPARLKATRLPNKPLAIIGGVPMVVQVWRRACEAAIGDVVVACDGPEIAEAIIAAGGRAIITNPDHPSGSDRVWEAVEILSGADARGGEVAPAIAPPRSPDGSGSRHKALRTPTLTEESRLAFHGEWRVAGEEGAIPVTRHPSPVTHHDIIINLQGDLPTLEPRLLHELLLPLANPAVDIATLVAAITRPEEHENPSVVKAVLSFQSPESRVQSSVVEASSVAFHCVPRSHLAKGDGEPRSVGGLGAIPPSEKNKTARALYFTRCAAPYGDGPRYHHIGVYAYRRAALERFVKLPPSPLEQREKLEQLRALEHGFRIDARVVDTVPLGVDTPDDLERARALLGA